MHLPEKIKYFTRDDPTRTAFSAEVMNEFVTFANAFLNMRGINGVRIYKSEDAIVIDAGAVSGSSSGTTIINQTITNNTCLCKYA